MQSGWQPARDFYNSKDLNAYFSSLDEQTMKKFFSIEFNKIVDITNELFSEYYDQNGDTSVKSALSLLNRLRNCECIFLFPRATSQVAACRHLATAARVKYPAALQRCKFDTPLLAAGSLIDKNTFLLEKEFQQLHNFMIEFYNILHFYSILPFWRRFGRWEYAKIQFDGQTLVDFTYNLYGGWDNISEYGSQVGCSLKRPTAQVEIFRKFFFAFFHKISFRNSSYMI